MAEDCNREFCVCTTHPNYQEIMDSRISKATDKTVKPTETAEDNAPGPSIGSMGVVTEDDTESESDTFSEDIAGDKISRDRATLYVLCKFGPDSRG